MPLLTACIKKVKELTCALSLEDDSSNNADILVSLPLSFVPGGGGG
jgi:hypothetical protein